MKVYKILVRNPQRNKSLERHGYGWEKSVKLSEDVWISFSDIHTFVINFLSLIIVCLIF